MKPMNMIAGGVFLVAVLGAVNFYYEVRPPRTTNTPRDNSAAGRTPAVAPTVVVKKIGKFPTLYKFGGDGCVTIFDLRTSWHRYPKGGAIKFISRKTGRVVLRDKPGIDQPATLVAGDYEVCRDNDPNAWGVEIWR